MTELAYRACGQGRSNQDRAPNAHVAAVARTSLPNPMSTESRHAGCDRYPKTDS